MTLSPFPSGQIEGLVKAALTEDLGLAGDITSNFVIPETARAEAVIAARDTGILAGLDFAVASFKFSDPNIQCERLVEDGASLEPGTMALRISGSGRYVLSAERVALNFLGHLSGIASETHKLVSAVAGTNCKICDTRKTTPGLRAAEKYAVRCGGGVNHRFGLYDAVLIKDNHIAVAGSVSAALKNAQDKAGHMVQIEIEVDRLDQLEEALDGGAKAILLDNMSTDTLKQAVSMTAGRAKLEASGRVSLDTVRAIAETGVDYISVGRVTHSAPCLDLGLDIEIK